MSFASCDVRGIGEEETVSAPDWALRVDLHVEVGDDAEVVATAAEGEEELWRGCAIDIC